MTNKLIRLHCLSCATLLSLFLHSALAEESTNTKHIYLPEDVNAPTWLAERQKEQLKSKNQFNVFHNFNFTDEQIKSDINFLHRIVDDAGKFYKAVHYDHGNGIAVADINNDELLDVYLVSQEGPNNLYLNLGDGKFKDITNQAGVAVNNAIGVTASFADIDNDGDADLYVTNVRSPNVLFENLGNGKFKDISSASGLNYNEHSSAAIFFDYDRDGLLDVFVCVIGQYTTDQPLEISGTPTNEKASPKGSNYFIGMKDAFAGHLHKNRQRMSRLYQNQGNNKFLDVTEETGLKDVGWTGDATPTDFNNDGWIDLYTLNMQGHDNYWINKQGKSFENTQRHIFKKTPWGAMGVKSFDYDNDGDLDLMITDMHSDMSEKINGNKEKLKASWITENWSESFLLSKNNSIYGNALYRNDGNNNFTEVSDELNTENYWPWGISVADLNADGWQDVFIASSMNYPFRYSPNTLLLNNNGKKFLDAEYILGIEPRKNNRTSKPWIQLNCSGVDKVHPHCKDQSGDLIVYGAVGTRSSAIFDLDNDGDLDIVTNEFGDTSQVLISNLSQTKSSNLNFVKIKLVGKESNRDGLGAKVTLTSSDQSWTQVHDGQSGYLSQSSQPLYFGLDSKKVIDAINIIWPNGKTQHITNGLIVNALNEIHEP